MKFVPISYILSNNSTNININKNITSFLLGNSTTKTRITQLPTMLVKEVNEKAYFIVKASGKNLTYLWLVSKNNGTTWANSTFSTATKSNLNFTVTNNYNKYLYRCVVTGSYGTVISEPAMLVVSSIFQIVTLPVDYVGHIGDTGTFTVFATGTDLSYQWLYYNNGTWYRSGLPGNKTDTVTIEITEARLKYLYRCKITQGEEVLYSNNVQLLKTFRIVTLPTDYIGYLDDNTVFHVDAVGENLTYQWYYSIKGIEWNKSTLSGAKTDTLNGALTDDSTLYIFKCIITENNEELIETNIVRLVKISHDPNFKIITEPENYEGLIGDTASFHVEAIGTNLTYLWQYNSGYGAWNNSTMTGNKTDTLSMSFTEARLKYNFRCLIMQDEETLFTKPVYLINTLNE